MPDPARINHISFSGEKHPVVDSRISDANITTWNSYSSSISDVPVERGIGTNSVQQKGNDLTVYGNYSFAEGISSTDAKERGLDGDSTDTEIIIEWESSSPETDKFTFVKGEAAHAEGNNGLALGNHSHVEGNGCIAADNSAHAEGTGTQANAECSHAEGWQTRTSNDCEHAEGQYNVSNTGSTSDKKTMHSVGIGTSSQRKNAFEIMQSGDTYMVGVGGYDGTNPSGSESVSVAMIQGEIVQEISPAEQYVSQELMNLLAVTPTMKVRWNRTGTTYNKKIFIYHPLMNYEDAEIVLLSYARKNGARSRTPDEYNKGYSIATPWKDPSDYFTFSAENDMEDLSTFMSSFRGWNDNEGDWVMPVRKRHFGIALRIPNPAYNGPETPNKNNTYRGVPESIWSAVLRIGIHYDNYHDVWGIGIR